MKRSTIDLFLEAREFKLPPYYAVDSLLPILASARQSGAIPAPYLSVAVETTDFDDACRILDSSEQFSGMRRLQNHGIKVGNTLEPVYTSGQLVGTFYMFRGSREPLDEIQDYFRQAQKDIREGRFSDVYLKGLALTAQFLGYPDCCAKKYVQDKAEGMRMLAEAGKLGKQDPSLDGPVRSGDGFVDAREDIFRKASGMAEKRAAAQIGVFAKADSNNVLRVLVSLPADELAAYFTLTAYPCEPTCEHAKKIGNAIRTGLRAYDEKVSEIYSRMILPANAIFVWNPNMEIILNVNRSLIDAVAHYQKQYVPNDQVQRPVTKVGRNDPCPCGSEIKFKKCCGGH